MCLQAHTCVFVNLRELPLIANWLDSLEEVDLSKKQGCRERDERRREKESEREGECELKQRGYGDKGLEALKALGRICLQ